MKCDELKTFTFGLGQYTENGSPCVVAFDGERNPRLASDEKFYLKSEADKVIAEKDKQIAELEEELEASKRKEKESKELADPYTLYCEASAEALRNALGEYRWHRPCDDRPPEWFCVIVYFHNEEGEEQYRLAVYSKENGWEVDDEEVYKTAKIEAWHPLPMPPEEAM